MYIQSSASITQSNLQGTTIGTVMTATEIKSNLNIATDTPHLTLMGEEKIDRVNTASHCTCIIDRLVQGRRNTNAIWSHAPPPTHQPIDIHMHPNSTYICVYMHLHINQNQWKNDNSLHSLGPRKKLIISHLAPCVARTSAAMILIM